MEKKADNEMSGGNTLLALLYFLLIVVLMSTVVQSCRIDGDPVGYIPTGFHMLYIFAFRMDGGHCHYRCEVLFQSVCAKLRTGTA